MEQTNPDLAALDEVTALTLRIMRVVTTISEAEQLLVEHAKHHLASQKQPDQAASLEQATAGGLAYDATVEAVARATPHASEFTRDCERLARTIRRTVALKQRIEAGWPAPRAIAFRAGALPASALDADALDDSADDRATLRQAVRETRARIRAHANGDSEAAERLFADLDARLDDAEFVEDVRELPLEQLVETLCAEIGIPPREPPRRNIAAIAGFGRGPTLGDDPGERRRRK